MRASSLVERAIRAAGGVEAWRAAETWEAHLSVGGLALRTRGHKGLDDVQASVATTGQHVVLDNFPSPSQRAIWDSDRVRIEAEDGTVIEERKTGSWPSRWDPLHLAAFTGLALWTYASLPFVLADGDIHTESVDERTLRVSFPEHIRTHCPTQLLHLDDRDLIRRHDYTALAFGRWATAAHHVRDHQPAGPVKVARHRRVVPRAGNLPLPGPTLVWIRITHANLRPSAR